MTPPAARHLLACDLDQTLIFSRRWLPAQPVPREAPAVLAASEPEIVEVEQLDGVPISFATARSLALLAELDRLAVVVPVTTRTLAQYGRIDLGVRPRFAVAANGGHLLVDGVPDPGWAAAVAVDVAAACAPLAQMLALARRLADGGWARLVRVADELFVYLVAHDRDAIPDLAWAGREASAAGWSVSRQGRKVYLVPTVLTKGRAVAEVVRRAGTRQLLAAGDSVLDVPMLTAADRAVRPAHGELDELGWSAPTVVVTAASGLAAGEEVLATLGAWVRSGPASGPGTDPA